MVGLSKPMLDDDEIKHHIKLAIGAAIEKNYDEAIEILHTALQLAQNKKNESAENYIFDMLANLYYQKGDFSIYPVARMSLIVDFFCVKESWILLNGCSLPLWVV